MKHINKRTGLILVFLFFVIAIVLVTYQYLPHADIQINEEIEDSSIVVPEVIKEYGLPRDSFIIDKGVVKRNQSLGKILMSYGVSGRTVHQLSLMADTVFDLRKIKAGNRYAVFLSSDSAQRAVYFIYEENPVEYITFRLTDSLFVTRASKNVQHVEKRAAFSINSSLWKSILEHDINPMVAIRLSEIYAWSIDFFGLQEGDSIRVIYEETYVDTVPVGIRKIISAYFWHSGRAFYAIPFTQGGKEDFYDLEGNSLKKAFLKAPLRFSRISSRFSHSRLHPILKIRRPHHGVDYAAPTGTPVQAIGDGKIIKARVSGGAGRMVKISHNSVYQSAYLHLSRYGRGIKEGKYVKQGDIIGYVGSTGLSTGPHLDFRMYKNGHAIDPLKVEAPPVEPVKKENMEKFNSVKTYFLSKLDF